MEGTGEREATWEGRRSGVEEREGRREARSVGGSSEEKEVKL